MKRLKRKALVAMAALALGLAGCGAPPVAAINADGGKPKGDVSSPKPGVLCDYRSDFCADSQGISLALTKEYLGNAKMRTWEKRLRRKGFDSTRFTFSNGVYCDTGAETCWNNRYRDRVDPYYTQHLF